MFLTALPPLESMSVRLVMLSGCRVFLGAAAAVVEAAARTDTLARAIVCMLLSGVAAETTKPSDRSRGGCCRE